MDVCRYSFLDIAHCARQQDVPVAVSSDTHDRSHEEHVADGGKIHDQTWIGVRFESHAKCDRVVSRHSQAAAAMPSLSLRINLDPDARIGPGKIELLEQIASLGSIAAAGRAMGMSYRRAWELVEELNGVFGKPVVARQTGGKHGGGATLTPLGLALVTRFRAIERAAAQAAEIHLAALQNEVELPMERAS